jgi:nanoRNase/pAp phosphatase (c-di-AMP/oligoRNAs hydrolase)
MRIVTRGDMDALTSCVLLTEVLDVSEVRFAHPKDVQDGLIDVDERDVITNLPYVPGCGMWFDHHVSEDAKPDEIGGFDGRFEVAPSCARVIYNHYSDQQDKFQPYLEMLEETDRVDSAQLSVDDVRDPQRWVLLAYTLDPRSGLGPEFRKYFRWLVEYCKEVPVEKVLQHTEVNKRAYRVRMETAMFEELLQKKSKQHGNVVVTDLREVEKVPVGNRFVVFTLFPDVNVELRVFWGKEKQNVVLAAGHSIFNRTCNVNLGKLFSPMGGGGHMGAGTVQVPTDQAEEKIAEVLEVLQANQAN